MFCDPNNVTNFTVLSASNKKQNSMQAVWQATGRPAISLPNGCRSLPMEVLPMLERFQKIYLWMDNDGPGQEGAKQFAQKIGLNRCYMVQPLDAQDNTCKDANEALLKGIDLEAMIRAAKVTKHENVMDFEAIRSDVLHEILHPDKYTGVPMTSLPMLTDIIKGFRRGELTILTGPTGSGKTTFLGQLSLDLAEQDVNVMWGSFEIKNSKLSTVSNMFSMAKEVPAVGGVLVNAIHTLITSSLTHIGALPSIFQPDSFKSFFSSSPESHFRLGNRMLLLFCISSQTVSVYCQCTL